MTSRIAGCLLFCLIPLLGCRAHQLRDAYIIEAFSAEVRVLEDKLYEYDHRLDLIERRLEDGPPAPRADLEPRAPRPSTPRPAAPRRAAPDDIPDLSPPEIDPGSPATPDDLLPDGAQYLPSGTSAQPASQRTNRSRPLDLHLARIEISPFTRALDTDRLPGADGIELIVVPLNMDGEVVPPTGKLTVVVVDAVERKHLSRWEFDETTTATRFQEQGAQAGIHVEIRFPEPLSNADLHLFVRLETAEGERLETDRPFKAQMPSDRLTQRWTQRTLPSRSPTRPVNSPRTATQPTPQGPPPEVYR